MSRGLYIVIEGVQGVGKSTQASMLAEALRKAGMNVKIMREPDSQTDAAARHIRRITQNPEYDINARTEVLLYNAGRSQSLSWVRTYVENGIICIVDRNYLSTYINQYYLHGKDQQYEAIEYINQYATQEISPDLLLVLDAPPEILLQRKGTVNKGEKFDDLNIQKLIKSREGYIQEARQRNIPLIDANRDPYVVHSEIIQHVQYVLGSSKQLSAQQYNDSLYEDRQIKRYDSVNLDDILTNTTDNVYVFNGKLDPVTVAAAMARLSRRGDDMRTILTDEFLQQKGKDENLLKRVITAYGDDSVQQLHGLHVVVEEASNLLTKKLEWGRLAAYLEQSTRYIYYDKKDASGAYKYVIPAEIKDGYRELYIKTLDSIFERYSQIVDGLHQYIEETSKTPQRERDAAWKSSCKAQACDGARGVLPAAVKSTVGIYASAQSFENLMLRLRADETIEARTTANKLLTELRKVAPVFFERTDMPDKGGARSLYMHETRVKMRSHATNLPLPDNLPEDIVLTNYSPKNELDLVAHMLYEYSDLSETSLSLELANWDYDTKSKIFMDYVGERLNRRMKPGRAFERALYSFDIVSDYGAFRDLQRHRIVNDLGWQELTPKYGFEIPEIVEQAGYADMYESCFDDASTLYSKIFETYGPNIAQYSVLLGHRMRWKLTMNARETFHFIELRSSPQGHPQYRKIALAMHRAIAAVHPLTAQAMKFVSKDEDPELARLAAERYSASKLAALQSTTK